MANLKLVDSLNLLQNAEGTGAYLRSELQAALGNHPHLGEVRGEGLLIAVEFVENRGQRQFFDPAKKVGPTLAANLLKEGIIARAMPQGDILGFAPPLCISQGEADQIVQGMRNAVKATFDA